MGHIGADDAGHEGTVSDVAAAYEQRGAAHDAIASHARRRTSRIAAARLITTLALILIAAAAWGGELSRDVATIVGVVLAIALVLLVRVHRRARETLRDARDAHAACVRGAARVRRTWAALREPAWAREHDDHLPPVADDLRLVGRASIAQLLDVVTPAVGGVRLRAWLLDDPPARATILGRQEAVREIATRTELLEACSVAGATASSVRRRTVDAFVAWGEQASVASSESLAAMAAAVLTIVGLVVWRMTGSSAFLAAALVVNLGLVARLQRALRATLSPVADIPALLSPVLGVLPRWRAESLAAPAWREIQARLAAGGGERALGRLRTILTCAETRYSPMLHWTLNAVIGWDAHILRALERWRTAHGVEIRGWLDALADAEALAALATLAHDNPSWAFPTLDESAPHAIDATALAHPLIAPSAVIGNDVHLEGAGSLLVVTGSNMAGKTTLLRSLGANVVLAQAGGPVCARAMTWRAMRVRTSIHVRDALNEGVSLFLAELRRLQSIVRAAEEPAARETPVLALLDEVLHGTNSRDRRTATRAILARLHAAGAVSAITTHDLELADEPALAPSTRHLHFREEYLVGADGAPAMRFDYLARDGKATSANALALLAALGLA